MRTSSAGRVKVVILGDVHGNARALRAALAAARAKPFDELVFIGDLLTYGHDVDEVLDLVAEAQAAHDATVLVGNHDQMYFDIARGDRAYFDKLPAWIRASIERTLSLLDERVLADRLRWTPEVVRDGVLFAHANPFGVPNWAYLNSADDVEHARSALASRGLRAGVFGHTHRPRWHRDEPVLVEPMTWNAAHELVINVGSVGQPRDGTGRSLVVRLDTTKLSATFEPIDYDVDAHVDALRASGLDVVAIERLVKFFDS